MGQETQLPSLELAMDLLRPSASATTAMPASTRTISRGRRPRRRFRLRLIRASFLSACSARAAARRTGAPHCEEGPACSIGFAKISLAFRASSGPADRTKVSQYLDTVREVERRIQKAEADTADNRLPDLDRPVGVPAAYADHARLMFDLQVLALQGDVTRVITFQLARETSTRTYPEIGVSDPHHPLTHHGNDPEKIAKVAKINAFHVSLFAYFLEKLKSTPEGDGSLLDHSFYLYGSGMGNPNVHDHLNLPILVAGGGAGKLKGGRHIKYAEPTPLANLHLTLLDKVGVRLDSFADSKGKVEELLSV